MNNTKLIGIIKTLVTEVHHGARYGGKLSGRSNKLNRRSTPDRQLQVAEENTKKKLKLKLKPGKTDTGENANNINTKPGHDSQIELVRGAAPKSAIDTK